MLIHAGFFSYADWCWFILMLIDADADAVTLESVTRER